MILTCPACGTNYVVKDGAIPPQGRQVRCASCKHGWHQDPEERNDQSEVTDQPLAEERSAPVHAGPSVEGASEPAQVTGHDPEPVAEAGAPPIVQAEAARSTPYREPDVASATPDDGRVEGEHVEPAAEPVYEPTHISAPGDDSGWNDADYDVSPERRGKGPLVLLLLALLVAALAVAAWFLAPGEWLARAGLRQASTDSPLKLMVTSQDRQKLASGNDLVSLSGRVINPTEQTLTVPPLQADLRDGGGKLVYSWTIAPPAARLPPRGSASFNAAELGVPPNATSLTLRWAS